MKHTKLILVALVAMLLLPVSLMAQVTKQKKFEEVIYIDDINESLPWGYHECFWNGLEDEMGNCLMNGKLEIQHRMGRNQGQSMFDIKLSCNFKNGKLDGPASISYEVGEATYREKMIFKDGILNGVFSLDQLDTEDKYIFRNIKGTYNNGTLNGQYSHSDGDQVFSGTLDANGYAKGVWTLNNHKYTYYLCDINGAKGYVIVPLKYAADVKKFVEDKTLSFEMLREKGYNLRDNKENSFYYTTFLNLEESDFFFITMLKKYFSRPELRQCRFEYPTIYSKLTSPFYLLSKPDGDIMSDGLQKEMISRKEQPQYHPQECTYYYNKVDGFTPIFCSAKYSDYYDSITWRQNQSSNDKAKIDESILVCINGNIDAIEIEEKIPELDGYFIYRIFNNPRIIDEVVQNIARENLKDKKTPKYPQIQQAYAKLYCEQNNWRVDSVTRSTDNAYKAWCSMSKTTDGYTANYRKVATFNFDKEVKVTEGETSWVEKERDRDNFVKEYINAGNYKTNKNSNGKTYVVLKGVEIFLSSAEMARLNSNYEKKCHEVAMSQMNANNFQYIVSGDEYYYEENKEKFVISDADKATIDEAGLKYSHNMVQNRLKSGIFDFEKDSRGYYLKENGKKYYISTNDKLALEQAYQERCHEVAMEMYNGYKYNYQEEKGRAYYKIGDVKYFLSKEDKELIDNKCIELSKEPLLNQLKVFSKTKADKLPENQQGYGKMDSYEIVGSESQMSSGCVVVTFRFVKKLSRKEFETYEDRAVLDYQYSSAGGSFTVNMNKSFNYGKARRVE